MMSKTPRCKRRVIKSFVVQIGAPFSELSLSKGILSPTPNGLPFGPVNGSFTNLFQIDNKIIL
jgi:hypothetical protein